MVRYPGGTADSQRPETPTSNPDVRVKSEKENGQKRMLQFEAQDQQGHGKRHKRRTTWQAADHDDRDKHQRRRGAGDTLKGGSSADREDFGLQLLSEVHACLTNPVGIADPEVISNVDIWDTGTGDMREEKPEGTGTGETEEEERNERENDRRTEPGAEGGTKSVKEEDYREDVGKGRKKPDSPGSLGEGPKTPTEIQRRHEQCRQVPGEA
ncbi:hypothetical protein NDU88_009060 [Pleurodeles waltl]|uniref:Uncharacterized protein n=1 Tax=Pleurodeles waltl TaxID=8319 RepID=A0AAV7PRP3_PLEWA|nr:hypothetical protein NDU88_009060 [Pleurodeles waltl]